MQPLTRNILTTYAARLSNILGLFFLFPLVARSVGQEQFGIYVLTSSLAVFFTLDLGMAGATTTYVARAWEIKDYATVRRLLASSTVFFALVGAAGAAVVALTIGIGWNGFDIPADAIGTTLICAAAAAAQVLLGSALSVNRHVLAGVGRLDLSNATQVAQILLRFALTVTVLTLGGGVGLVAIADFVAVALGGGVAWYLRRRQAPETIASIRLARFSTFKGMFRLTWDFLVISLAAVVILQSGNLIVSVALPIAMVAVYGAAVRVYQVTREVTNSLTAALLPASSSNHARGDVAANRRMYFDGTRFANVLLFPIAIPIIVLAEPLIRLWMGPGYEGAVPVAQILVLSLLVNNLHLIAVPVLGGQGDLRTFAKFHTVWAVSTLVVGIVLTPLLGIVGMAIAVAGPVVLLEPAYVAVALRRLGLPASGFLANVVLRPLLPGIVVAAALIAVALTGALSAPVPALIAAAATALVYLMLYFLIAAPSQDKALVRTLARKILRRIS